ncbi:TIGR03088 family PEP-CTERM/XrtA system glycosyltransferase [Nitrosovibrio sp. Nv4]|uniref:TIGR03088 family PEP-CTERM/XrtA system glycosyltransferase n=1 Tax=Nitrosovibrio sp. Nv4 TaxID=1945880 RepID=UPI000BDC6BC1|nr:TIGR03088 family PEP-CTERM/XrtA system glycosyltransferase [Nitrosovibrio sp. Nv4]SOD39985.1 sugar transferase, PEP-CTERM/EpsH1 system associated [Nitrosovibrio sp. Nv4]
MQPPLIVHVIHHLGVGGLENGLVNLINHIPPERYRHAIVCLKGYSDFRRRIIRENVEIVALHKREGQDFSVYLNLFKTFKRLRPDIVHTRNLGTMEGQVIAAFAGARARVHGEHGRDVFDLYGKNRKYNLLRKGIRPFVNHFITVSKDLEDWLINTVGATPDRINQIYNGVDSLRFHPRNSEGIGAGLSGDLPEGFFTKNTFVIGSVGRMTEVKNFPSLIRAFLLLVKEVPEARERVRLLIIGEGNSRQACADMLRQAGAEALGWFPGERADIPQLMRAMDLFVLPSLGEGISNTILEAMSTGLPVIATSVGGNAELVREGRTGMLIPPDVPAVMKDAILKYYRNPILSANHGKAARQQIEASFSLEAMTQGYLGVYDKALRL